ncbi:MAG: hypothetical protein AAF430_10295 [Myxococcota bacterium]
MQRWIRGLAAVLLVMPLGSKAQLVIDDVQITSGPAYVDDVFSDYFLAPVVRGSGIASVQLTSQFGGIDVPMVETDPDQFECDEVIASEPCENFAAVGDLTALGSLTFQIVGDLGEMDTVVVPVADWDPAPGQGSDRPNVAVPQPGASVASGSPLSWSAPPAWVQAIAVSVEESPMGDLVDEALFFGDPLGAPATDTSWTPTGIEDAVAYDFPISFVQVFSLDDPRTSSGGRAYLFSSGYSSENTVSFVPEPGFALSFACGVGLLMALASRRAPSFYPQP